MSDITSSPQPRVIRAAVDFLTVTTKTGAATATLLSLVMALLGGPDMWRKPSHKWNFKGYRGRSFDGCSYGIRGDEGIVMLHGEWCQEYWSRIAPSRQKCTRVDLAVTVELAQENTLLAERGYDQVASNAGITSSIVMSSKGGSTVYLGSRQSQFMGRLYDKGAEEGLPSGMIWRYEVECKKPASEAVVTQLLDTSDVSAWVSSYVERWFSARGLPPVYTSENVECELEVAANVTTPDRRMAWLRTSVRPTVGRLCIEGFEAEVRDALGLPAQQISFASLNKEFE